MQQQQQQQMHMQHQQMQLQYQQMVGFDAQRGFQPPDYGMGQPVQPAPPSQQQQDPPPDPRSRTPPEPQQNYIPQPPSPTADAGPSTATRPAESKKFVVTDQAMRGLATNKAQLQNLLQTASIDQETGESYCPVCNKGFTKLVLLKSHLKMHDPSKSFQVSLSRPEPVINRA
jgi:hypothetical protein